MAYQLQIQFLISKNYEVREGLILPEHRKVAEMVMERGHAVPLDEETKKKREELGLELYLRLCRSVRKLSKN